MLETLSVFEITALMVTLISGFLIVYSHMIFPVILKIFRKKKRCAPAEIKNHPTITLLIPAYNEQDYIADKIINLSTLDYPSDKLKIVIYCDGCTDYTAQAAQSAIYNDVCAHLNIELIEEARNIGKIAALNKIIPAQDSDLIALSDVSALLSMDALQIAAAHFEDPRIGFVGGTYDFAQYASAGEETYWRYQRSVKQGEGALGGPIGCHGAFYLFRRGLFKALPADTVNDDFIVPMNILAQGYQGIYEPTIMALELEQAEDTQDFNRRIRISTGNVQQVFRLLHLLHPKHGGVALSFFSGKALRAFMPVLLFNALAGAYILSCAECAVTSMFFGVLLALQIGVYALAVCKPILPKHKIVNAISYLVSGHMAGLIGLYRYITGAHKVKWSRASSVAQQSADYSPLAVRTSKRAMDIIGALCGLVILVPLFPVLALLIKLDSPGPVLFTQMRVGLSTPQATHFFRMVKFRTMVTDAEKKTGAVWAQKDDPRITRVGRFLRKTRIDELPQLWNVLIGDMSLIGPRPERPELYGKLSRAVPFFQERNYGVRPGITGPAQIHNGYDATLDDVRNKAGYDHSYALSLSDFKQWIMSDVLILFQTIGVVIGRRGQ